MLDRARLSKVLGVEAPTSVQGVGGVTYDSRRVGDGFAFVAVPGFKREGAEFAAEAIRRGASLVVAEREVPGVPTAVVGDARAALADLAREVNGDPSRRMRVYGVTGTNGKTTTSYVLYGILAGAHGEGRCGLMTTAETIVGAERRPAVRTTPEATEVQGTLAAMLERGVGDVVMEVSSHGIALKRVAGTRFAGAIFTNLTRDHLDLHGSMQAYYSAKRELFHMTEGPKLANGDDAYGRRLAGEIEGVSTFGSATAADYGFEVIVDYAHTDVGLDAVLKVARGVAGGGRVICVFGAAGDRDGAKRPKMGEVASRLADMSFITTDDAYSEDPGKIAGEVEAGSDPSKTHIELDRRSAIRRALGQARVGDVVVVAGKGHETVQHLPEGDVPFHDATVVGELLAEIEGKGR